MGWPKWKTLLSWIWPQHLETVADREGHPVSAWVSRGRLQLTATRAIYSYDDYYVNFLRPLKKMYPRPESGKQVLLLGFGLGSIVYILEKVLRCDFDYTAVEFDEAVIYLASHHSLPRFQSPVALIQGDAADYVTYAEGEYDLICMDVFEDDLVPPDCETVEFLQYCRALLLPGGVLLYNRLYQGSGDKFQTDRFAERVFSNVFPDFTWMDTEGNRVLIGKVP
jgi:spermidine synthase